MTASVRVEHLNKTFALAEEGGGPVSMFKALRQGKRDIKFRHVQALHDISFIINKGERVGIIGRNGAGKTTLLSILAGISKPTSGKVEITGDVHAMLTIGTVLREEATGRENIYLDGAVHGYSHEHVESHAEKIIAFTELGEFIDRPVRTYSSGMKARLAFAMGAFIKTDILIIDETLSAGDAAFSRKATRRMKELTSEGQIVIVVSHSLSSITEICNRCLWLADGRLIMDGTPEAVTYAYRASVEEADEAELMQKFGKVKEIPERPEVGHISAVELWQTERMTGATVQAFQPQEIVVRGVIDEPLGIVDVELALTRVDGKRLWYDRLGRHGGSLVKNTPFVVSVRMDPMILGAHLYRLDATLFDDGGPAARISRVFEVIDEQGQIGGRPMLYYSPVITVHAEEEYSA